MNYVVWLLYCVLLVSACSSEVCEIFKVTEKVEESRCVREDIDYYPSTRPKVCLEYGIYINNRTLYTYGICTNVQILNVKVVSSILPNTNYVTFVNSNITTIKIGTFNSLTNVKEVYLNNTQLTSLQPGVFSGLSQLEILRLENNHLKEIFRGVLNSLVNLAELNLTNNKLSVLEEHCFNGLLSITRLDLSHNNLTSISNETFVSLQKLQELYLDYNHIAKLEGGVFYELPKINHLSLSNNRLSEFSLVLLKSENLSQDGKVVKSIDVSYNQLEIFEFSDNMKIEYITLSHNHIKLITDWSKLRNIRIVDLSFNKIAQLSSIGENVTKLNLDHNLIESFNSSFFANSSLNELILSNNAIAQIDQNCFKNLQKLKYLSLNNNQLSEIPIGIFKNMSSLETLSLSHNVLKNLNFGTFVGLNNLKELNLSSNQLVAVSENSLHTFTSLYKLDLSNNRIENLDANSFSEHLSSLTEMWLDGNLWNCTNLLQIFKRLGTKKVWVHGGLAFDVKNVYGIECNQFLELTEQHKKNSVLEKDELLVNINLETLDETKMLLKSIDDLNSKFSASLWLYTFFFLCITLILVALLYKIVLFFKNTEYKLTYTNENLL